MGDLSAHFNRSEFTCNDGCGFDDISMALIDVLEELRERLGRPIVINSGCRCASHNDDVGGTMRSQHVHGKAADFKVLGLKQDVVQAVLLKMYPDTLGIGRYAWFTHVDVRRGKARW